MTHAHITATTTSHTVSHWIRVGVFVLSLLIASALVGSPVSASEPAEIAMTLHVEYFQALTALVQAGDLTVTEQEALWRDYVVTLPQTEQAEVLASMHREAPDRHAHRVAKVYQQTSGNTRSQ